MLPFNLDSFWFIVKFYSNIIIMSNAKLITTFTIRFFTNRRDILDGGYQLINLILNFTCH